MNKHIDKSLADADIMDRGGYPYVIHPLTDGVPRVRPELLEEWVAWAQAQDLVEHATLLLAPEAMALPLAATLSMATKIPYGVVRKRAYDLPGEEVAYADTAYSGNALHINDVWPDDRVLVVDDVCSTGGTLAGIVSTLQTMNVQVVGALVFLDKGTTRSELETRLKVPIRAMRSAHVAGGRLVPRPTALPKRAPPKPGPL